MTLTQMNVLLNVVACGGFTEAGKRLFMTQSAVSQAVSALEDELGLPLLIREKRKMLRLTAAGERVVNHIRTIMHEVHAIKEVAEQEKHNPVRWLRIGCFPSICACVLPHVVRYFEKQYPQIKIIPYEANSADIIERLHEDQLDAGFVHFPVSDMHAFPFYQDRFTVVVPEDHAFAQRKSVSLEELFNEPLIISKGRYELSIMSLFKEMDITPTIKYEFNHPSTAISFIRQGLGIALLPELTLTSLDHNLCSVPLEPVFYRHISLITKEKPIEGSPLSLLQHCLQQWAGEGIQ